MDEQACPRCKTTKYRNPGLKLLVNTCGHSLCENCVELLFVRGSGACPECNVPLRRSNFRVQLFEDAFVEKEVDIRKRILRDFNKKEEDFDNLREYNDYLEMVETIIFNLANDLDVEATKKQIEQYKRENKDLIMKNKSKMSKDDEYLENLIEQEKAVNENRRLVMLEESKQERNMKKQKKDALIDDLMFSDRAASDILAGHKLQEEIESRQSKVSQFSSGIRVGQRGEPFLAVPKEVAGSLYVYEPFQMEISGPLPPDEDDLIDYGYIECMNIEQSLTDQYAGGGFLLKEACHRVLQEAFCGLYFAADEHCPMDT